jgi:hypothetical protein
LVIYRGDRLLIANGNAAIEAGHGEDLVCHIR